MFTLCVDGFLRDFTRVTPESSLNNTPTCPEGLFKLLGMAFAEAGPKAPPFDVNFKTLGLQIDLKQWPGGEFTLQHTDSRKLELVEVMRGILEKKLTKPKELERLHGWLVRFNAYIFGRRMNRAVSCISRSSRLRTLSIRVEPDLMDTLMFLCEAIENHELLRIHRFELPTALTALPMIGLNSSVRTPPSAASFLLRALSSVTSVATTQPCTLFSPYADWPSTMRRNKAVTPPPCCPWPSLTLLEVASRIACTALSWMQLQRHGFQLKSITVHVEILMSLADFSCNIKNKFIIRLHVSQDW